MRMQLEEMGSTMSDDQFLIHVLNNLTGDYELQVALLEKRIGNSSNPLTVDELGEELNLNFERMNAKKDDGADDGDAEQALVFGQFKGKFHNCGKIGHKVSKLPFEEGQGNCGEQVNYLSLLQEAWAQQV